MDPERPFQYHREIHQEVNEIITGKRKYQPKMGIAVAAAFGTSEDLRLGLQKDYDLYKLEQCLPPNSSPESNWKAQKHRNWR